MKEFNPSRRAFVRDISALGLASLVPFEMADAESAPAPSPGTEAQPAEDSSTSLHRLTPVPIDQVVVEDEFWSPKRQVWQGVTIRDCFRKFETDRGGAINNFDKVRAGQKIGRAHV